MRGTELNVKIPTYLWFKYDQSQWAVFGRSGHICGCMAITVVVDCASQNTKEVQGMDSAEFTLNNRSAADVAANRSKAYEMEHSTKCGLRQTRGAPTIDP